MSREIEYVDPYDLTIIGLDTDDNKEHHLFQERVYLPVDENLVKNIKVYGIQMPVLVRKDGDKMIVVDGRQRTRAARQACDEAKEAGEHPIRVPVRTVVANDSRATGIMISTNELRQDDTILDKALQASRLLSQYGDVEEVAIAFGRTAATIKNWLLLVEADPQVHTCIRAGKLSVTTAIEISRLKREEQLKQLDSFMKASGEAKISTKAVKEVLVLSDSNKAAAKSTGDAADLKKSGKSHNQQGIKRVWLRRALGTAAAGSLTDEQKAVLNWICTGESQEGQWFDDFRQEAEEEMSTAPKGKRGRKPKIVAETKQEKPEPEKKKKIGVVSLPQYRSMSQAASTVVSPKPQQINMKELLSLVDNEEDESDENDDIEEEEDDEYNPFDDQDEDDDA